MKEIYFKVGDLFNLLPEPYRTQAINNVRNPKDLEEEVRTISEAINSTISWYRTPEGQTYWSTFHSKLQENDL